MEKVEFKEGNDIQQFTVHYENCMDTARFIDESISYLYPDSSFMVYDNCSMTICIDPTMKLTKKHLHFLANRIMDIFDNNEINNAVSNLDKNNKYEMILCFIYFIRSKGKDDWIIINKMKTLRKGE